MGELTYRTTHTGIRKGSLYQNFQLEYHMDH